MIAVVRLRGGSHPASAAPADNLRVVAVLPFRNLSRDTTQQYFSAGMTEEVATQLSRELEHRLGKEARPVILGHTQRGGTPTAYDRVLATRFGWHAVEAAHKGAFGHITALQGTDIRLVPLGEAVAELKTVPQERYVEAETVI